MFDKRTLDDSEEKLRSAKAIHKRATQLVQEIRSSRKERRVLSTYRGNGIVASDVDETKRVDALSAYGEALLEGKPDDLLNPPAPTSAPFIE